MKVHTIRIVAALILVVVIVLIAKGITAAVEWIAGHSEAQAGTTAVLEAEAVTTEDEALPDESGYIAKYGCVLYQTYEYPWNQMSQDWDDIDGFYYHDISNAAVDNGGEAPVIAQVYLYCVCKNYGVDYEVAFALIEHGSYWRYDAVGDDGDSIGLMMVQPKWHMDTMEELHAEDLTDPYANMAVGVEYLAQMYDATGNWEDALAAYNYGLAGARLNLWSKGQHECSYNKAIMERAQELKKETAVAQAQLYEGARNESAVRTAKRRHRTDRRDRMVAVEHGKVSGTGNAAPLSERRQQEQSGSDQTETDGREGGRSGSVPSGSERHLLRAVHRNEV